MKRTITLCLCLLVCISMFGRAKPEDDTSKSDSESTAETVILFDAPPTDEHEKYRDTVTITTSANVDQSLQVRTLKDNYTMEENPWADAYKEYLNIEREYLWITTSTEQSDLKRNLAISSGDIPDYMVVNQVQLQQLAEAGVIIDNIYELLEEYGTDRLKTRIGDFGDVTKGFTEYEGEYYGLGARPSFSMDASRSFLYIRKDWLENVNLEAPTTYEEFMAVAEAFVEDDPDGNGKDDTYAFAASNIFNSGIFKIEYLFNMYGAYYNTWLEDGKGNLVYSAIQPEMKTALIEMNKMYEKGWIDPEFGIKDADTITQDISNSKIGMTFGDHWIPLNPVLNTVIQADENADWIVVASDQFGADGGLAKTAISPSTEVFFVINKECENPEAIIKMMNLYLDLYETQYSTYGNSEDGRAMWQLASMAELESPYKNMDNHWKGTAYLRGEMKEEELSAEQLKMAQNMKLYKEGDRSLWSWNMIYSEEGCEQLIYDAYINDEQYYFIDNYQGSKTQGMIDYESVAKSITDEAFIKIIIGDQDPSYFDEYVGEWKKAGGGFMTEEVNEWYDNQK